MRGSATRNTRPARSCASTSRQAAWAGNPAAASTNPGSHRRFLAWKEVFSVRAAKESIKFCPFVPIAKSEMKGGKRPVRILLVDDEPALRELLRATFEGADVQVDEAAGGLEAEACIEKRRPDVIVLDLRMPGISGAELCSRLKAGEHTQQN